MPDDAARILQFILDAPTGSVSSTALREFIGDRAHQRIESLESMGFIEVSSYDVSDDGDVRISAYEITPCGRDSLAAFHKQQHERACEEAEKRRKETLEEESRRKDARRSWVQWTITTVLTIASFFTGAVVEMFTGFMEWIASLFH